MLEPDFPGNISTFLLDLRIECFNFDENIEIGEFVRFSARP